LLVPVRVPEGVVTVTVPVVPEAGTTAVMYVSLAMVKLAEPEPNITLVVPVKPLPRISTVCPAVPEVVISETNGGIHRWKDGRNMPDVHAVLFEYANVPVYMRLSLDTESTEVTRFMGSKGVIELTEFGLSYSPQLGVDLSPSYYSGSFPARLSESLE
jgi:hypothetical protein